MKRGRVAATQKLVHVREDLQLDGDLLRIVAVADTHGRPHPKLGTRIAELAPGRIVEGALTMMVQSAGPAASCLLAHRATACIDCHKPPNMETSLLNVNFKAAPTQCEDCHEDIHGKQFSNGQITHCADCHNSMKWKPSLFDHDRRTTFPLAGAHQNVRCGECHKLTQIVEGKMVLFYKPTRKECAACHGPVNPVLVPKPHA